jgi:hypothetical protein
MLIYQMYRRLPSFPDIVKWQKHSTYNCCTQWTDRQVVIHIHQCFSIGGLQVNLCKSINSSGCYFNFTTWIIVLQASTLSYFPLFLLHLLMLWQTEWWGKKSFGVGHWIPWMYRRWSCVTNQIPGRLICQLLFHMILIVMFNIIMMGLHKAQLVLC